MSDKILIVEDSRTVASLIKKKIARELGLEVFIAQSMKDCIEILKSENDFFLALLDLNLPDAPDGEIVDFMLDQKIPSIVLTGNLNKNLRERISEKDIVDYLLKGRAEDIHYLGQKIKRLQKNRDTSVLVVDDSDFSREQIKRYLENQLFQVKLAKNGIEAMAQIKKNDDISIVMTDYYMPEMDGLELTKSIRARHDREDMAIIALSSSEEEDMIRDFLKYGANDFIKKPFSREEFECRINNIAETQDNIQTIKRMASRDYLTEIYNRRYFFEVVEPYYDECVSNGETFAIAMLDIDDFKIINDTFGHSVGDSVIKELSNKIVANTKGADIASRFGGEEFCLLIKDVDLEKAISVVDNIRSKVAGIKLEDDSILPFSFSAGVTVDKGVSLAAMINLADLRLYEAKRKGKNRTES